MSQPRPSKAASRRISDRAFSRAAAQRAGGQKLYRSAANRRRRPGAMFMAFWAASITMVPLPQKGSQTRLSRRTRPRSAIAAARVSLMGAPVALRR